MQCIIINRICQCTL